MPGPGSAVLPAQWDAWRDEGWEGRRRRSGPGERAGVAPDPGGWRFHGKIHRQLQYQWKFIAILGTYGNILAILDFAESMIFWVPQWGNALLGESIGNMFYCLGGFFKQIQDHDDIGGFLIVMGDPNFPGRHHGCFNAFVVQT